MEGTYNMSSSKSEPIIIAEKNCWDSFQHGDISNDDLPEDLSCSLLLGKILVYQSPSKSFWAQPVQPTRPPDSGSQPGYIVHPSPRTSWDYPRFKGHDARYITRSCARSFSNNMSPIKDRAPEIGGHGTRNVRAPEAMSSSTTDPRTNREQS
jgi:hypothetical protein